MEGGGGASGPAITTQCERTGTEEGGVRESEEVSVNQDRKQNKRGKETMVPREIQNLSTQSHLVN